MAYHNNHYNVSNKERARELRNYTVSRAEKFLWKSILCKKMTGVRFLRQRPIDNFIVDFFSPDIGLIIEIDGSSHISKGEYDSYRQSKLESFGFVFLRFSEGQVLNQLDEVVIQINHAVTCLKEG